MSKLLKPGDVDIKTLAITSANGNIVSIKPQLINISIYSNIFDKFLSGDIVIKDAQNLQNLFPLVGNEVLSIKFETPSLNLSVSKDFFIYKMSEKYKLGREDVYCLYFISFEAISSKNIKISKTFRGDSVAMLNEILSDRWMNTKKPFFGEIPKNRFSYISNFWNGVKNIDYICDHSVNENDSPTFVFYETNLGFHFNSLDTLISNKNDVIFNFVISEYEKQMLGKDSAVESMKRDYMQVQEVSYKNGYDFLNRLDSGFYGGRSLTFDPITGRYIEKQIKIENKNKLNEFDCISDNFKPASDKSLVVMTPKSYNNIDDSGDNTNSDYRIIRKGTFSRLQNQRITIKVFGRSDYFVGQKVNLKVSRSGQTTDEIWDKYLSGNYLITSVKHSLGRESYYSYLELSKGSYSEKLS